MLHKIRRTGIILVASTKLAYGLSWAINGTTTACRDMDCSTTTISTLALMSTSILSSIPQTDTPTTTFESSDHLESQTQSALSSITVPSSPSLMESSSDVPSTLIIPATLDSDPSSNSQSNSSASTSSSVSVIDLEQSLVATSQTSFSLESATLSSTLTGNVTGTPNAIDFISSSFLLSPGSNPTLTAQSKQNMTMFPITLPTSTQSTESPVTEANSQGLGSAGPSSSPFIMTTRAQESVTATWTTMPDGVSTELVSLSGVSTNTWYTTTMDGQPTILPVIWHSKSGGSGELILIWNLASKLTNIEFVWPGLPSLTFSCIQVFGVTMGDCPAAETTISDTSDGDKSLTSTTSPEVTATTTSTSESCSSTTVSDCRRACIVSTLSASSVTTNCYTTTCFHTVGCSIQPTTSASLTTASRSQKTLKQNPTPYQVAATWSSFGIKPLAWYLGATITLSGASAGYTEVIDDPSDETGAKSESSPTPTVVTDEQPWCYTQ